MPGVSAFFVTGPELDPELEQRKDAWGIRGAMTHEQPFVHLPKARRGAVWTALLCVGLVASTQAADLEIGLEAYERGDYEAALREFRPLAEQGNAVAQFHLGVMYEYGRGAEWNPLEAVTWYRKAALGGHRKAQAQLGTFYLRGHVVGKNDVEAYAWLDNAALQGDRNAARARDELAESLAPDVVARGKERSRQYREGIR